MPVLVEFGEEGVSGTLFQSEDIGKFRLEFRDAPNQFRLITIEKAEVENFFENDVKIDPIVFDAEGGINRRA